MDKRKFINFGKGLFNEVKGKLIEQGRESIKSATDDFINKTKETVINATNDKILKFSSDSQIQKGDRIDDSIQTVSTSADTPVKVIMPVTTEDAVYRNADQFEKQLDKGLSGLAKNFVINNPVEAAMVFKEMIGMVGEVSKFTEVQKTKRREIEMQRDKYLENIQAQKEVMLAYLDKSFDERKDNFSRLFAVVDHALASNNIQQLTMSLNSINNLVASSPFKDLATIASTQQALNDKDHTWDI